MREVPIKTKVSIRATILSRGSVTTQFVLKDIKRRDYEWPYKRVHEKHVVQLLQDMGLHKRETNIFPWHCWTIEPPTQQERAVKFLKWANDNKVFEVSYDCCCEHTAHAEGFQEATDTIIERLKIEFPEIFA
jgi:hypothetical protein